MRTGSIEPHPTLVEVSNGIVSQAEAQVLVTKEGCEIIAKVEG
jgi:methionine aminopeptidase